MLNEYEGKFIAFDLETTGLSSEKDDIIEIAMVKFETGQVVSKFSQVTKPQVETPLKVMRLTKIPKSEIQKAKRFSEILKDVERFRGNLPFVGHNAPFDTGFLSKKIEGFPDVPVYDTLEMSRILFPTLASYKLGELAKTFGLDLESAHRAYDDAEVCGRIFLKILKTLSEMGTQEKFEMARLLPPEDPFKSLLLGSYIEKQKDEIYAQRLPFTPPVLGKSFDEKTLLWVEKLLENRSAEPQISEIPFDKDSACILVEKIGGTKDGTKRLFVGLPQKLLPDQANRLHIPSKFLCLKKLEMLKDLLARKILPPFSGEGKEFLPALFRWTGKTETGDLREFSFYRRFKTYADEISCGPPSFCPKTCKYKNGCYAYGDKKEGGHVAFSDYEDVLLAKGDFDKVFIWDHGSFVQSLKWKDPRFSPDVLRGTLLSLKLPCKSAALRGVQDELKASFQKGVLSEKGLVALDALKKDLAQMIASVRQEFFGYDVDPPFLSLDLHLLEKIAADLNEIKKDGESIIAVEKEYKDDSPGGLLAVLRPLWPGEHAVRKIEQNLGAPHFLLRPSFLKRSSLQEKFLGIEGAEVFGAPHRASFQNILCLNLDLGSFDGEEGVDGAIEVFSEKISRGLYVVFPSKALLLGIWKKTFQALEQKDIAIYSTATDGKDAHERLDEEKAAVFATARGRAPDFDSPDPFCIFISKVPFNPPNPADEFRKKYAKQAGLDGFLEVSVKDAVSYLAPHLTRMLGASKKCCLLFADPRLLPGKSAWSEDFFQNLIGRSPKICPLEEAVRSVLAWLEEEN